MSNEVDPRQVIQRYNERIGKTTDPFAVAKLEETRDRLKKAVEELDGAKEQYRVIVAGHQQVESDESEALAKSIQQQIQEKEQEVGELAGFLLEVLEAGEEGRDLREFIQEKREEQVKAAQAQFQAQSPGPMGPPQ